MPERIQIDCCPVDCVTRDQALARCLEAFAGGPRLRVAPVNAATVVQARSNPQLRLALERMDLLLPDGFYIRPASMLTRQAAAPHTATVPLTLRLLERLDARGGRAYLLGARGEVVHAAAARLTLRFPGLRLAGARDGYFSLEEEPAVLAAIHSSHPDLLLVGISSPQRDMLLDRWHGALRVPVTIGVGGMIDILGGRTPEGPDWLRRIGMMWLYRLLQEPRRMGRRYTLTNARFIMLVLRHALFSSARGRAGALEYTAQPPNESIPQKK